MDDKANDRIDEQKLLANVTQRELIKLVDRARQNPRLAAELIMDPERALERNEPVIDTNSKEFQDLAVRLYFIRTLMNQSIDELRSDLGREMPEPLDPLLPFGYIDEIFIEQPGGGGPRDPGRGPVDPSPERSSDT